MPCSDGRDSPEYIAEENRQRRQKWAEEGRWDLLASREQLSRWLCDAVRGEKPAPELLIPFVDQFVKTVDQAARLITVDWEADYS